MPYKGFGLNPPSITGIEELISLSITGEVNEIVIDPGTANTAPTVTTYYNPRFNISIEGISSGVSVPATFTVDSKEYVKTGETLTKTTGDVVKVSVTGVHNPDSTLGT
ncbi:MAG: hypothetical protein EBT03_12075 [Betaproteobacteria bacterium]|nr:hypothetical protein [Betaproteobacteria bacterium]